MMDLTQKDCQVIKVLCILHVRTLFCTRKTIYKTFPRSLWVWTHWGFTPELWLLLVMFLCFLGLFRKLTEVKWCNHCEVSCVNTLWQNKKTLLYLREGEDTTHLCHHTHVSAHTCVTTHLCHHTPVSPHTCVTTHLCHHTPVSPHTCVTTHLCQHTPVSAHTCVTTHLCHHTPVSPHTCVTTHLCHHTCVTTHLCHHTPVSPHTCHHTPVSAHTCHHTPVSAHTCVTTHLCHHTPVTTHLCHHTPVSAHTCVTTHLCHHTPVSPHTCVTTHLCHHTPVSSTVLSLYMFEWLVILCHFLGVLASHKVSRSLPTRNTLTNALCRRHHTLVTATPGNRISMTFIGCFCTLRLVTRECCILGNYRFTLIIVIQTKRNVLLLSNIV